MRRRVVRLWWLVRILQPGVRDAWQTHAPKMSRRKSVQPTVGVEVILIATLISCFGFECGVLEGVRGVVGHEVFVETHPLVIFFARWCLHFLGQEDNQTTSPSADRFTIFCCLS